MDLTPLFLPKSMAVIGLSLSNDHHPANVIHSKNLLRYPLPCYGINPKGGTLNGEPIYTSIHELPQQVDLAVIAVRAEIVPQVLNDCISAGVKSSIIISGGFAEAGKIELQEELTAIAIAHDFPFIGPNCLGLYSPDVVDTFFLPAERMVQPRQGGVAVVSQSGGILVDLLVKFATEGVGISSAISIGNKALVREPQLLEFLAADERTRVIALYIEGFSQNEGRAFVRLARDCGKPVIVLKSGKTREGSRAVSSHTASLAGDYQVFSAVLRQHGIMEAANEHEMVSFCEALSCYPETRIEGRIGIVSSSGGHGALAVDACIGSGLKVPPLSDQLQTQLQLAISPSIQAIAALSNPIDLTGSAQESDFVEAVNQLAHSAEIDCILLLMLPYLPGIGSDLGARLSQVHRRTGKPLIAYVPHVDKYQMLIEGFELNRVPVASSIESAVKMTRALRRCRPC